MKKTIAAILFALLPAVGMASGGGVHLDKAHIDPADRASQQRGAKMFVNYCQGCHSAKYMRYSRMAQDLGMSNQQVIDNLMLKDGKIGDTMTVAMKGADAKVWFGKAPPDLSVVARARGTDWLYTYLRTFYQDTARPMGVNNLVFKDVGMPHVLIGLQGLQAPVYKTVEHEGHETQVLDHLELVKPGSLSPAEYDEAVRDLVNFLDYVGEPIKLERQRLGIWVLLFLAVFFVVAFALKKEYWKDVH